MRRFLLHLKLEAWRVWPWIALWVGLLALRGARFAVAWHEDHPENFYAPQVEWYLDLPILLMAVLPFIVMKLDDAGNPKAFSDHTRPRGLGDLVLVKLTLLFLVVVGGWAGLSGFEMGVAGYPIGWGRTTAYETARALLVMLVTAAAAWVRPGWRQPLVIGAVMFALWFSAGMRSGPNLSKVEQEVVLAAAFALAAVLGIVWILRCRRPVPYALMFVAAAVGTIIILPSFALVRTAVWPAADAARAEELYSALAEELRRGSPVVVRQDKFGQNTVPTAFSFSNPFRGEPMLAEVRAKNDWIGLSSWVRTGSLQRAGASGNDKFLLDLQPQYHLPGSKVFDEPVHLQFYRVGRRAVMPTSGGELALPGSRTVIRAVERTEVEQTVAVVFDVFGTTTLMEFPARDWQRFSGAVLKSGDGFYRLGLNRDPDHPSYASLPEPNLIELRHRDSGETLQFEAEPHVTILNARDDQLRHYMWRARAIVAAPDGAYGESWLENSELVIRNTTPAGEVTLRFNREFVPLKEKN